MTGWKRQIVATKCAFLFVFGKLALHGWIQLSYSVFPKLLFSKNILNRTPQSLLSHPRRTPECLRSEYQLALLSPGDVLMNTPSVWGLWSRLLLPPPPLHPRHRDPRCHVAQLQMSVSAGLHRKQPSELAANTASANRWQRRRRWVTAVFLGFFFSAWAQRPTNYHTKVLPGGTTCWSEFCCDY